ncbi:hypothetical protein QZH41_014382, partial [Actinostola sp. cb2023]
FAIAIVALQQYKVEKENDRSRLDLVQEDEDKAIGTVSWRLYRDYFRSGDLLPNSFTITTMRFFYFFGVLVLTGIVNYWQIIAVIPTLAVLFLLGRYYLKPARDLCRLEAILRSPVYAHISETMEGLEVIHSLQMEDWNVEKFYNLPNVHTRAFSLVVSTSRWVGLHTDGICALFVTAVAVATVYLPSDSVERVRTYTRLSAEPGYERQEKPSQDWPDLGAMSLQGVSMVYLDGGACVLKDITFDVKPKEKVGIAGRTGTGKSSLVAALFRMPDPQGHLLIDGIDLVVLDEATANVDYKTDQLVQQVIREKFGNCTVLSIAHRLNTIMDYDRVLVLDRGHVVEYDSPTILAANSDGVFAQLLKTSDMTVHTKSDD